MTDSNMEDKLRALKQSAQDLGAGGPPEPRVAAPYDPTQHLYERENIAKGIRRRDYGTGCTKQVRFNCTPDEHARMKAKAKEQGISLAMLILHSVLKDK